MLPIFLIWLSSFGAKFDLTIPEEPKKVVKFNLDILSNKAKLLIDESEEIRSPKKQILLFTADWCGPCQGLKSEKIYTSNGWVTTFDWARKSGWIISEDENAHIRIVDVDKYPELWKRNKTGMLPEALLGEKAITPRSAKDLIDLYNK